MIKQTKQIIMRALALVHVSILSVNLLVAGYWTAENSKNKAIISVPVADAATKPLAALAPKDTSASCVYDTFACSPGKGLTSCARVHQQLFNEVVTIEQESGEEVQYRLENLFYEGPLKNRISTFWILKKNIKLLQELSNLEAIPQPYACNCNMLIEDQDTQNIIILTLFWHDEITQKIYSAGTRFVGKPELDTENSYAVLVLTDAGTTEISWVPYACALRGYAQTQDERIQRFLQVLKQWTQVDSIAYIWGGCSFTKVYNSGEFYPTVLQQGTDTATAWIRPDKTKPYSGFDCSGLILRAAQIAGLPYFFKNTTVLSTHLQELKENDILEAGDLIYHPGHVMVISDVHNNQIIESAGYSSGYGKVHNLPLNQVFENIYTCSDLLAAYSARVPLRRLKLSTAQTSEIKQYKLLKLRSIFLNLT